MSTENTTPQNVVDLSSPLSIYNATEAAIEELRENYLNLKVAGIQDKDGYEVAKKGLRILVGLRNKIDKRRLELKRQVDNGAKDLLAKLAPIESNLNIQVGAVDAEIKRLEAEKKEAERIRFVNRTNKLFELGFTFNGVIYTLGHHGLLPSVVNDLPDDVWATNIAEYETTSKAIAEQKAAAEAEAARLKYENERLRKELEAKQTVEQNIQSMKQQGAIVDGKVDSVNVTDNTITVNTSVQFPKPSQTVKIPVSFKDEVGVTDEPTRTVVTDYQKGFEACKEQIIAMLKVPQPISRAALITQITNLKP